MQKKAIYIFRSDVFFLLENLSSGRIGLESCSTSEKTHGTKKQDTTNVTFLIEFKLNPGKIPLTRVRPDPRRIVSPVKNEVRVVATLQKNVARLLGL